MQNIDYLLKRIKLNIPKQILHEGFKQYTENGLFTIDSIIRDKIIFEIVLTDCNLFSGKIKKIRLDASYHESIQMDETIVIGGEYYLYRIPPEVREFQPLTYPLDISYPSVDLATRNNIASNNYNNTLYGKASEALTSFTGGGFFPTPKVIIESEDIIKLIPPQMTHIDWIVSCIIGYDKSFSSISPGLLKPLSKMCIEATKMWLYNELNIELNKGMLIGGKELGKFKDIIESYADASEKYDEYLLKFRGSSQFDKDTIKEWIGMMF